MIFFFENRAVYEIMWKYIEYPYRPRMTIWHMRIACCIPKSTNIISEYVILVACQLQQWLHDLTSVLRYTYIACPISLKRCRIYRKVITCPLQLCKKVTLCI
jgi:hypothetical protein